MLKLVIRFGLAALIVLGAMWLATSDTGQELLSALVRTVFNDVLN